jgi:outer membrane lipoprotein carrier protein
MFRLISIRTQSVLLLFVSLLFSAGILRGGDDAADILEKLRSKVDSIRDATVVFTQTVRFGITKSEQSFHGTFVMRKGNKYRIEMDQQTIVTDGKSVWSYSVPNNQVLIDKFKDDPRSYTPDKILVELPANSITTSLGKEKIGERECTILKMVPKDSKAAVTWMKVWVEHGEWLAKKIQVLDVSENLTTYTINGITINKGIPDSQFRYTPPPGAEVIDVR